MGGDERESGLMRFFERYNIEIADVHTAHLQSTFNCYTVQPMITKTVGTHQMKLPTEMRRAYSLATMGVIPSTYRLDWLVRPNVDAYKFSTHIRWANYPYFILNVLFVEWFSVF